MKKVIKSIIAVFCISFALYTVSAYGDGKTCVQSVYSAEYSDTEGSIADGASEYKSDTSENAVQETRQSTDEEITGLVIKMGAAVVAVILAVLAVIAVMVTKAIKKFKNF